MNSSAQRKDVKSSGVDQPGSTIAQLMREMGSAKGFDPMPPDQYLTYQDERYPPALRLWAWLLSKTIRYGHRSPYAVDEDGRELWRKHAEAALNMDRGNLRRAWMELEADGRVREEERRLIVCGSVPLAPNKAKEKRSGVCTDSFPPYLVKQIKRLPPERQEELLALYGQETAAEAKVAAEALAGVRSIFDQRKHTLLSGFGIKKIRGQKDTKAESPLVPLLAKFLAESVQTPASPALRVCSNHQNGSVQTRASLCVSETKKRIAAAAFSSLVEADSHNPPPPIEPTSPMPNGDFPYPATLEHCRSLFPATDRAFVLQLAAIAKQHRPEITDTELASCVVKKRGQQSQGLFIATVAPRVEALNQYERQHKPTASNDWEYETVPVQDPGVRP